LGATVVQCNPLSTEAELTEQLTDCAPAAVVCLDRTFGTVERVRRQVGIRHVVVTSLADYLPTGQRLRLHLPLPSARASRARLVADIASDHDVQRFRSLAEHKQRAPQSR